MLGIYIREWKITCVTVVASTHDQPICRHSRFCTNSTRGDTDETSLVKMTKNSFPYSLNDEGIGLVIYPTPFRVVVTKVEGGWSLAKTCQREDSLERDGWWYRRSIGRYQPGLDRRPAQRQEHTSLFVQRNEKKEVILPIPHTTARLFWGWRPGLGTIRNIPSENDRKTIFRCSLNDEELDELCTQHRFESWSQKLKSFEVWE